MMELNKKHFERSSFVTVFKKKLLLRFHMFLILGGVFFSGLLTSKALLELKVKSMPARYVAAVVVAYLVFFLSMKLWLWYVSPHSRREENEYTDIPTGSTDMGGGEGAETGPTLRPGGGEFGGAGAGGSFDARAAEGTELFGAEKPVAELSPGAASESADAGTSAAGDAASVLEEGGLALAALGAVLLVIFGAGAYLIYEAPMILSEAAFEFFLASGLLRGMRRLEHPDWVGGVFRATWVPFAAMLVLSLFLGIVAHEVCPGAAKLVEVYQYCF